jgi:ribonuclease G
MNVLKRIANWIAPGKEPKRQIVINAEHLETRVAILDDNELEDLDVERVGDDRIVGSIFKGKVQNLEDNLQAAFIDIGQKRNAFIHYWDMIPEDAARLEEEEGVERNRPNRKKRQLADEIAKQYPAGSEIIIQVTKAGIGAKGPRVSANLSVAGRYLVMMPGTPLRGVSRRIEDKEERDRLKKVLARLPLPDNVGMIVRTAGMGTRRTAFVRDARALLDIWTQIETGIREQAAPCRLYQEPDLIERTIRDALTEDIDRILVDSREQYERIRNLVARISRRTRNRLKLYDGTTPIFEYCDVERQLLNSFRRKVWLKSGGYLVIDETEALVAIDVNTGRHKGGKNQEEAILQVNLEAAVEIARQMRLRNIGGLVVLDFIDMKARKDQNAVYRKMRECLRRDKARTNVLPISDLGLMEMTRQRVAESLRAAVFMDCPYCEGRGKVKSVLSMSVEIQRHLAEIMRRRQKAGDGQGLRITVNPIILDRLRKEDEEVLVKMEKLHGNRLTFVPDPGRHLEEFVVTDATTGTELYSSRERENRSASGQAE